MTETDDERAAEEKYLKTIKAMQKDGHPIPDNVIRTKEQQLNYEPHPVKSNQSDEGRGKLPNAA